MPFAFGQKINLVQGQRSGINPVKWGFLGDVSGGQNGQSILAVENLGVINAGAMAIPNVAVCGSLGTCIGQFGSSADAGFTSGNNINNNLSPYGSGNLQSPEKWRNVEIPPNANGITFYIQTRPAPPRDVIRVPNNSCDGTNAWCNGNGVSNCSRCTNGTTGGVCNDNDCSVPVPYCCGSTGGMGAESGNYSIYVDLTAIDQQTLYLYTSWFNGIDVGGYYYDGNLINCVNTAGTPSESGDNVCSDNMRFLLFPRAADVNGNPPPWPYSDMTSPLVDIRVFRAGHTTSPTDGQAMDYYVCRDANSGVCPTPQNEGNSCQQCTIGICDGCQNLPGTDASESFITATIFDNNIDVVETPLTHEEFWGSVGPGGVTDASNTGIWNTVFGWNSSLEDSFISVNYGGPGLTGGVVLCGDSISFTEGDVNDQYLGRGCTATWKEQLPAGSTYANGITGAQMVGFHVG